MKKLIKLLLVIVTVGCIGKAIGMAQTASKSIVVPNNQYGAEANPLYAGAEYTFVSATTEVIVSTGPTVLLGVWMSTGSLNAFAIFKDTSIAGIAASASNLVYPRMQFSSLSSQTVSGLQPPFPVRFKRGISATLSSVATGESITVLYQKQR